jgi:hypothetical protein
MTTFDSTKTELRKLLDEIVEGEIQLPDFQRGWVWDDEHIRSLLVSIARSFPIGAVMLLETGGKVRFQVRPVEGVSLADDIEAERLILDGQQRLTSLTQVLRLYTPVTTRDEKKRDVRLHYYFDIERALANPAALGNFRTDETPPESSIRKQVVHCIVDAVAQALADGAHVVWEKLRTSGRPPLFPLIQQYTLIRAIE